MIPVTRPYLPSEKAYNAYVKDIWQRCWLTNGGPLMFELEKRLGNYLGLQNILAVSNGTIALQLALKALNVTGEVITTPFSYIATTSSIVWEGNTPVFVDIDPNTLNIDATKIESAITSNTKAILATHVYGNPCDVEAIEAIAKKHDLKVIYDAAHAFGVQYKGRSLYTYGDISTASFHATKLFHTTEGGGLITNNKQLYSTLHLMRNFGHTSPNTFEGVGINAKMSEFHAAMGLLVLEDIDIILKKRREIAHQYSNELQSRDLKRPLIFDESNTEYNYAYYPVLFSNENMLLKAVDALEKQQIFTRRYFYPGLNTLNYVKNKSCPISDDITKRVLCLPMYHNLTGEEVKLICRIINSSS